MSVHDTQNPEAREDALQAAVEAVREGRLVVLPTDTVYGIGADAFSADAVDSLLTAKGRGRDTPPPVLVGDPSVLLALAVDVPEYAEQLAEEFWPGPLTLILTAQPSLTWDLGETRGTVALRMPDDEVALDLLRRTGPLAVSSANRHGRPAALSVLDAATQLGDAVEVYLDGGPARLGTSSTIIDTTVEPAEIVREGALSKEQIIEAVGDIFTAPAPPESEEQDAEADSDPDASESREDEVRDGDDAQDRDAEPERVIETGREAEQEPGLERDAAPALEAQETEQSDTGEGHEASEPAAASAIDLPTEPDLTGLSGADPDSVDLDRPRTPSTHG